MRLLLLCLYKGCVKGKSRVNKSLWGTPCALFLGIYWRQILCVLGLYNKQRLSADKQVIGFSNRDNSEVKSPTPRSWNAWFVRPGCDPRASPLRPPPPPCAYKDYLFICPKIIQRSWKLNDLPRTSPLPTTPLDCSLATAVYIRCILLLLRLQSSVDVAIKSGYTSTGQSVGSEEKVWSWRLIIFRMISLTAERDMIKFAIGSFATKLLPTQYISI